MFGENFRLMFLAIVLGAALSSPAWGQVADRDISGTELRNFDGFLDSHPSIQRDLNQNPGLAANPLYLAQHSELREFLARHPGVREEVRENPGRFVRADRRWDRREDWRDRDRDRDRDRARWTNGWRDGDHDRDDRRRDRDRDDRRRDRDHDRDRHHDRD
jgi:hypothetical protein